MREARAAATGRYDRLDDTHRQVARDQFHGRYDDLKNATPPPEVVRAFHSNAHRTTEPAEPDLIRMYRGIGNNVGIAQPGDALFFTTDPSDAAIYGQVHYVDVTLAEMAKFESAAVATWPNNWRTADPAIIARLRPLEDEWTTEPAAPIWDREADNSAWEAKLADAAIAKDADRQTRNHAAEAETSTSRPTVESAPDTATRPDIAQEPETATSPASGAKSPDRVASGIFGGFAKTVENALSGLFSFFGAADTKLSPQQTELNARAADERAEANAAAAAEHEKQAAKDQQIFNQDRDQQQRDMNFSIRFGRPPTHDTDEARDIDREPERDRD